jgi:excisionase family DNA binding protein
MSADVLTTAELAKLLDCEESTIIEKSRLGELPGIKIGRSWVFPHGALMHSLNGLAMGHAARVDAVRHSAEKLKIFDTMVKKRQPPKLPTLAAQPSPHP